MALRAMLFITSTTITAVAHAQSPQLSPKRAPQPTKAGISAEDLITRLFIFAADSMEGRKYLTAGSVKATDYLAAELKRLGLEPAGDSGTYFQTLLAGAGTLYPARNVAAILRGRDPVLRRTYVALGAHSDAEGVGAAVADHDSAHVFRGRLKFAIEQVRAQGREVTGEIYDSLRRTIVVDMGSLHKLGPARRDSVYNGADDDGSGSVAMLEIAEALAKLPQRPKRSILFVWHTGEEAGLLGSKHFLEHPTVPRDSIIAQVNLDMIGRGRAEDMPGGGSDLLLVIGSRRLSSEFGKIVDAVNADQGHKLRLDYSWDALDHVQQMFERSDHYEYAQRGIPVVFFTTGLHGDYHEPTDEPQYIDYPHLEKITRYVHDLVLALGGLPKRLAPNAPAKDSPATGR